MIRFGHLDIEFDDRVLTPRPWTRMQSEWAADLLADLPEGPVLELCSGAGQIGLLAIALAPSRNLVCVDVNPVACAFTRANAERGGLAHRVEVREARIEQAVPAGERYALVIADPPWVPTDEIGCFPEDPVLAIDGGRDGTAIAELCLTVAAGHLLPGGAVLLQLGTESQAQQVVQGRLAGELTVQEIRFAPGAVVVHLRAVRAVSPAGIVPR